MFLRKNIADLVSHVGNDEECIIISHKNKALIKVRTIITNSKKQYTSIMDIRYVFASFKRENKVDILFLIFQLFRHMSFCVTKDVHCTSVCQGCHGISNITSDLLNLLPLEMKDLRI